MAYQLDRYNGTFLVSVEDGSIETNSTDLRFVGKNYAGYGELQNENFLHLLENFANNTPPPRAISGQIWYDSGARKLKYYDNNRWKLAGGAEVSVVAPNGLEPGEFWFDSASRQLYTWTGQDFVLIGPEIGPELGAAGVTSQVVKELVTGNNFTVLRLIAGGKTIGVISQDEFILDESVTPIEDFFLPEGQRRIKKGFNLTKTNVLGVSFNDYNFWGTASNSLRLGGIAADQYLRKDQNEFNNEVSFKDPGFSLGNLNDLRVRVENNDQVIFENRRGNDITFRITISPTEQRDVVIINKNGVEPRNTESYNLGRINARWNEIYGKSIFGAFSGNITGDSTGTHKGNVIANDNQLMINAQTKTIGFEGCTILGTLQGNISGSSASTEDSNKLTGLAPSSVLPSGADKRSVVTRNVDGDITVRKLLGIADNSDRLLVVDLDLGTYSQAKIASDANTIAARDSGGNLNAVLFQGTATAARYADLAEKYLADREYDAGTVVSIGGDKEITEATDEQRAIGVISSNPAFMMNKDLEGGTYVAIKGRVPTKVLGPVKKGDRLIAGLGGVAKCAKDKDFVNTFAISLDEIENEEIKIIETLVI